MRKGFTLLELLIVIGILAILSTAVVLVLNPAQLLAEARDSQRLSDLSAIQSAIALYLITATSPDMQVGDADCPTPSTCTDPMGTVTFTGANCPFTTTNDPGTGPTCDDKSAGPSPVDGTGWVTVNLNLTTGGSPLATLPQDPSNLIDYYYAYAGDNSNNTFELNTRLESQKFRGKMTEDGGNQQTCSTYVEDTCYFETGTEPGLDL